MPSRMIRLTFHNAVTSEISDVFSALESASVEMVCETPKTAHHVKNPGRIAGQPPSRRVPRTSGRRTHMDHAERDRGGSSPAARTTAKKPSAPAASDLSKR